jgi:acyl transferase domain-containing protein
VVVKHVPGIHVHCNGIETELSLELLATLPRLGKFYHGIKRMLGPDQGRPRAAGFAAEYALVQMWKQLGVTPSSFSGDGIGGVLAECLSGRSSMSEAVHAGIATGRSSLPKSSSTERVDSRLQRLNIAADCSQKDLLSTAAQLFVVGVDLNWTEFHAVGHSKLRIPTYPFQRERYWIGD